MKPTSSLLALARCALCVCAALVLSAALPSIASAQAPPVPPAYQDLYPVLQSDLDAFNANLSTVWNGSTYPVIFAQDLQNVDGNTGPSLVSSPNAGQLQLQELAATGIKGVMVQVEFPILYPPFYDYLSTQPGFQGLTYQQFANFYQQVAQSVRAAGLKLIVEDNVLLSNDVSAGWAPMISSYYATESWSDFEQARAQNALNIVQVMQPDYLVVLEQPDTEAQQTGQANVGTVSGATDLVNQMLTALQPVRSSVKVGAGVETFLTGFDTYVDSFVALPLDFIDMHIYPINNIGPPNNVNFLQNALTIASIAGQAGMPVAMTEAWMWKMRDSEFSSSLSWDEMRARDPFSFWAPLDAYFLQTMENLANYTQMLFMAPENPNYFFAYQDYDTAQNLSISQIISEETTLANQANLVAAFTSTAMSYYQSLVLPSDTIPPSTPSHLTGVSGNDTTSALTWNASTDNIAVAGYYVLRNGVTVATTGQASYQDSGLTDGTTYTYAVEAFDLGGNISPPSLSVQVTTMNVTPPTQPTNLVATATSAQQIKLTWTPSTDKTGVSSYWIFQGTSPGALSQIATQAPSNPSFTNMSLSPATTYYFAVQATDGYGNLSPMSLIASATTLALPSTPANVVATASSSQQIKLTWSASTGSLPVTSYKVYRGASSSSLSQLAVTNKTTYTDTSVSGGTTYYYAVQAADSGGDLSLMSAIVSATPPSPPSVPANVTATASSATQVKVAWSPSTSGGLAVSNYHVYRGTSSTSLSQLAVTTKTSYTDNTVSSGTTYYYAVQAADTGGDLSPMSAAVPVTTPLAPSAPLNVTATAVSCKQISLTWSPAVSGGLPIASYHVMRGTSASSLSQVAITTSTSYKDSTVSATTTYYYAVQAVDTGGDYSPMSGTASATTPAPPAAPTNVVATALNKQQISVSWSAAASGGLPIASYHVFRGSSSSNLTMVKVITAPQTSYTDSSATAGSTYYYGVEAVDTGNDVSVMSNVVSVTTPH